MATKNHCRILHKSVCENELDCPLRFGAFGGESQTACGNGDLEKLKAGYDPTLIDDYMKIACRNGHLNIVIWLHEHGADIRKNDDSYAKYACMNGHLDILMWLHEHGVDVRSGNDTCMVNACMYGHLDIIRWLHEHGVELLTNESRILNTACTQGKFEVIKLLHELGADLRCIDKITLLFSRWDKYISPKEHEDKMKIAEFIKNITETTS